MFDRARLVKLTSGQRKLLARRIAETSRTPDDERLVAYLLVRPESRLQNSELRQYLAAHLPGYMIPSTFVILPEFPRSPSGKVDRAALSAEARETETSTECTSAAPLNEIEQAVARVWQEVLGLSRIGSTDNFFDLGGHSLLLVRLQTKLREVLGTDLTIVDLFRYPTVRSLSNAIQNKLDPHQGSVQASGGKSDDVHARAAKRRAALRCRNSGFDGGTSHE